MYSVRVTYLLLERSCEVKTINMYQFPVSPVTKQVSIMSYLLSLHHLAQGEAIRRTRVWNEKKPYTFTRWFRKRKNATFVNWSSRRAGQKKPFVASQSTLKVIRDCVTKSSQHPPSSQIQTEKYFNLWGQDILCLFLKPFSIAEKKSLFFLFLLSPKPIVYWLQRGNYFIEARGGKE